MRSAWRMAPRVPRRSGPAAAGSAGRRRRPTSSPPVAGGRRRFQTAPEPALQPLAPWCSATARRAGRNRGQQQRVTVGAALDVHVARDRVAHAVGLVGIREPQPHAARAVRDDVERDPDPAPLVAAAAEVGVHRRAAPIEATIARESGATGSLSTRRSSVNPRGGRWDGARRERRTSLDGCPGRAPSAPGGSAPEGRTQSASSGGGRSRSACRRDGVCGTAWGGGRAARGRRWRRRRSSARRRRSRRGTGPGRRRSGGRGRRRRRRSSCRRWSGSGGRCRWSWAQNRPRRPRAPLGMTPRNPRAAPTEDPHVGEPEGALVGQPLAQLAHQLGVAVGGQRSLVVRQARAAQPVDRLVARRQPGG